MADLTLTDDIKQLQKELKFPDDQLYVAVRARFCCEYCGKSFLDSVDAYDSWQIDHIVPNGDNSEANLALACKTCNFAKRHSKKEQLEKCKSRNEKIELARQIVWERRARKEITLMKVRKFAQLLLMRNESNIV